MSTRLTRALLAAIAVLGALAAGCAASGQSLPAPAPERGGTVAPVPGAAVDAGQLVHAVRADAARMLGLADAEVLRVTVQAVVWGDGAIGCPRAGLAYTQAQLPGWRLVVSDGRREWLYHASDRGQWLLCPAGRAQSPLPAAQAR